MDPTTPSHPQSPRRQGLLDESNRRRILAIVANGGSRRAAARSVGCNPSSITRLALRDPQFARQLADAQQAREAECLQTILTAAFKHHNRQAAAWLARHDYLSDFAAQPLASPILDRLADLLARLARMSLHKALLNDHPSASCPLDDSIHAAQRELDPQQPTRCSASCTNPRGFDLDGNNPPDNTSGDTHSPKSNATP